MKIIHTICILSILLIVVFLSGCASCPTSCDDGIKCTEDYCSTETNYKCVHDKITPCCGNNIVELGETCSSCPQDVHCPYGQICCEDVCKKPLCTKDEDCIDDKIYTEDMCINPNSCDSICLNSPTIVCKEDGFCPDRCTLETDPDCLSESLKNTKYNSEDIEEVKKLAKQYKFDTSHYEENYELDPIPIILVRTVWGQKVYTDETMFIWIWTPFLRAVQKIADKEKKYEEYSDSDIIKYLQKDYIQITLIYGKDLHPKLKDLGSYETMVIKEGNKIFRPEENGFSDYISSSTLKAEKIKKYTEFNDKKITLTIIGQNGEKNIQIDMNKFK